MVCDVDVEVGHAIAPLFNRVGGCGQIAFCRAILIDINRYYGVMPCHLDLSSMVIAMYCCVE